MNPYESTPGSANASNHLSETANAVRDSSRLPHAELVVRSLGVFFFITGIIGVIGHGANLFYDWLFGYIASGNVSPGFPLAWMFGSSVEIVVGVYLMAGGRLVMDAVYQVTRGMRNIED